MDKLFRAIESPNEETRIVVMQTLVEIGKQEYDSIQHYFE